MELSMDKYSVYRTEYPQQHWHRHHWDQGQSFVLSCSVRITVKMHYIWRRRELWGVTSDFETFECKSKSIWIWNVEMLRQKVWDKERDAWILIQSILTKLMTWDSCIKIEMVMTLYYESYIYDNIIINTEIMMMIVEGEVRRKTNYCPGREKTSL